MPLMTKQSCNTSDVLIGQPPFPKIRGQEAAPCQGDARLPCMAALKDNSFLLTAYHSKRQKATKTRPVLERS